MSKLGHKLRGILAEGNMTMFECGLYFPETEDLGADGNWINGTGAFKKIKDYDSIHKVLDWMKGWSSHNFASGEDPEVRGVYTFRLSGFEFLQLSTEYYEGEYTSHRGQKLEELSKRFYKVWDDQWSMPDIESIDDSLLHMVRVYMIEKYAKFVGKPNQSSSPKPSGYCQIS